MPFSVHGSFRAIDKMGDEEMTSQKNKYVAEVAKLCDDACFYKSK